MVVNIAICDDDKFYIEKLCELIKGYGNWQSHTYKIHIFNSGEQLINKVKNGTKIDIVFMDVQLENNSLGTNIGIELKTYNPNLLVTYISFFDSYYEEMVTAEPFDFLHKPISQDKMNRELDKAIMRLSYIKREFVYRYKFNGITRSVDLNDVLYFESQHRIVNIYCSDGSINQFYEKLDDVEKDIEWICPFFLRVNKSYYVNFNYITKVSNSFVSTANGEIKLGKQYKQRFHEKYDMIVCTWYT